MFARQFESLASPVELLLNDLLDQKNFQDTSPAHMEAPSCEEVFDPLHRYHDRSWRWSKRPVRKYDLEE